MAKRSLTPFPFYAVAVFTSDGEMHLKVVEAKTPAMAHNTDLPPLTALCSLTRCLRHANSDAERRAIMAGMNTARRLAENRPAQDRPESGTSLLARRIIAKCKGQTMHVRSIAVVVGKSVGGTPFKKAIRELVKLGNARQTAKGTYAIISGAEGRTDVLDIEKKQKSG